MFNLAISGISLVFSFISLCHISVRFPIFVDEEGEIVMYIIPKIAACKITARKIESNCLDSDGEKGILLLFKAYHLVARPTLMNPALFAESMVFTTSSYFKLLSAEIITGREE